MEVLPPEMGPDIEGGKNSICDIKCIDQRGHIYIVEVQKNFYEGFLKRIQYYGAKAYVDQILTGDEYKKLKPVILLSILDHVIFKDHDNYISFHHTVDKRTGKSQLQDLSYVFIELPKYKMQGDPKTLEDYWMYLFAHWDHNEIPKGTPAEIQEAYTTLEKMHWSKEAMEYYFKVELKSMDEHCKIQTALRQGMQKGLEQGREQGLEQGLVKGLEQGLAKGREESLEQGRKEKVKIIKNLFESGMELKTIAMCMELSVEDIKKLIEK